MNNKIQIFLEKVKKSPLVLIYWHVAGRKIPPPHVYKQKAVELYGKKFNIPILYESGTYKGDMAYGMRKKYKKITTIELSDYYYEYAKKRLKNNNNIKIIKGDSEKEIKKFLKSLKEPCVFWLDGHFSFGKTAKSKINTPIVNELKSILNHSINKHVILIDDAREFKGKDDYPKINKIKKMLKGSDYTMEIKYDIIRITPQNF